MPLAAHGRRYGAAQRGPLRVSSPVATGDHGSRPGVPSSSPSSAVVHGIRVRPTGHRRPVRVMPRHRDSRSGPVRGLERRHRTALGRIDVPRTQSFPRSVSIRSGRSMPRGRCRRREQQSSRARSGRGREPVDPQNPSTRPASPTRGEPAATARGRPQIGAWSREWAVGYGRFQSTPEVSVLVSQGA